MEYILEGGGFSAGVVLSYSSQRLYKCQETINSKLDAKMFGKRDFGATNERASKASNAMLPFEA